MSLARRRGPEPSQSGKPGPERSPAERKARARAAPGGAESQGPSGPRRSGKPGPERPPAERKARARAAPGGAGKLGSSAMYVRVDLSSGAVELVEPDNFKQFHVAASGPGLDDDVADALGDGGRRCDTPSHVHVAIDL